MNRRLLTQITRIELSIVESSGGCIEKDFIRIFIKAYNKITKNNYTQIQEIAEIIYLNYSSKNKIIKLALRNWENSLTNTIEALKEIFLELTVQITQLEAVEVNCDERIDEVLYRSKSDMLKEEVNIYSLELHDKKYTIYYMFNNNEKSYLSCRIGNKVEELNIEDIGIRILDELKGCNHVVNKFINDCAGN